MFYRDERELRNFIEDFRPLSGLVDDPDALEKATVPREGWLKHILPTTDVWLLFPAKLYCGQSLLDGRRESIIIDYAYNDDIAGYQERPDALTGRNGLRIRDEIRMIRPGFYLGRAYANKIFLLNFMLYERRGGRGRQGRFRQRGRGDRRLLGRRTGTPRDGRMRFWLSAAVAAVLGSHALAGAEATSFGPDVPPRGEALLSRLFPEGLPFPFEAALERLRALAGPENVETALIPLGRSLQRYAAAPEYFASPRLVVAVTGDRAAGPDDLRLADRLFLGYQPAAEVVEAISYNADAGRFEFQEIVGYGSGGEAEPAERHVCLACHQGRGPIFARPLWAETNANPAIAARLAPVGPRFHGAPVHQSVDGLEAFDAATDRAARLPLASRLWSEACPDATCRAALLTAALRIGLGASVPAAPPGFAGEEVTVISPDLPNRDPLLGWDEDEGDLETTGMLDPQTPRPALVLWSPGAGGFAAAAREIAAQFSPGDFAWIDDLLRRNGGPTQTRTLRCATTAVALPDGGAEARFDCKAGGARLAGFRLPDGAGRIDALSMPGWPPAGSIALPVAQARAPDGRRIGLELSDTAARVILTNDLDGLEAALAERGGAALAVGPFPREAVLALLATILGGTDG